MPTLSELMNHTEWEAVECCMRNEIPAEEEAIKGYQAIFMDLRSRTPIASTGFIEFDVRLEGSDDGRFSVHGREGFNADGSPCGELLALDFVPWTEWLGTAIAEQTLLKATPPSIIAHCLWEMTFWGGDGNEIQAMVNSTNDDPEQAS